MYSNKLCLSSELRPIYLVELALCMFSFIKFSIISSRVIAVRAFSSGTVLVHIFMSDAKII